MSATHLITLQYTPTSAAVAGSGSATGSTGAAAATSSKAGGERTRVTLTGLVGALAAALAIL